MDEVEPDECINAGDGSEGCAGMIEYRMPLSGTGQAFPRCEFHWDRRLELEDQLNERYPVHAPADWSPMDAGEAWGPEDY